ncbi:MAG: transcriptional regulator NrdR [Cyanobacteria bacterium]|nr:transcriptional regulator NrdR [Cyanobacteriota bacterium]MDW8200368.1 transcriptional regulator NrdR [Cyanobacteriota bacterium SKYGB_h_bin112]
MRCPVCQHSDIRVLESRSAENGQSVRRRRECLNCGHRFTTYERIEFVPITVIKRDGKRESFDRSKLLRGIVRATEKTGISLTQLESLVDEIEADLQQRLSREVSSAEIGEIVLRNLRSLSEVAYIRFASVYQQFRDIADFVHTLDLLQRESNASGKDDTRDQPLQSSEPSELSVTAYDSPDRACNSNPKQEQPIEVSTSVP